MQLGHQPRVCRVGRLLQSFSFKFLNIFRTLWYSLTFPWQKLYFVTFSLPCSMKYSTGVFFRQALAFSLVQSSPRASFRVQKLVVWEDHVNICHCHTKFDLWSDLFSPVWIGVFSYNLRCDRSSTFFITMVSLGSILAFFASGPSEFPVGFTTLGFSL